MVLPAAVLVRGNVAALEPRCQIERMKLIGFRALLIEARRDQVELAQYRSQISSASVLSTLDALVVRCGLHVFWCDSPLGCAETLQSLVRQFVRGIETRPWPAIIPPFASIRMGLVKPKRRMLSAIWRICFLEWVRAFRG